MDKSLKRSLVNLKDFEDEARRTLPKEVYDYLAGGAGDEITVAENIQAYNRLKLCPRVLKGVGDRDTSIKVLDKQISTPILIAPTAFHCLAHQEGELATVKAAVKANTIMIVSMASTVSLEEIALTAKEVTVTYKPNLWFQLYIQPDAELTESFVRRVENAGYNALVVTVDSPVFGMRERDIRNGFHTLPEGLSLKNFDHVNSKKSSGEKTTLILSAKLTWEDIDWLKSITRLPIFIKGIVCPDDALIAMNHQVDGIIVSNHGGRQLDTLPATIDMLPQIISVVNHKIPVIVDGGVRRGTDVLKAIALGADAVAIGRPVLWGLTCDGEVGVTNVLNKLKHEFDLTMALCGCSSVKEIKKHLIYSHTTP